MGGRGSSSLRNFDSKPTKIKVQNQAYESENYQIQKVQYTSFARGTRGSVRSGSKTGYILYDSFGNLVTRDSKDYNIEGYRYPTLKAAKEVVTGLEERRRK